MGAMASRIIWGEGAQRALAIHTGVRGEAPGQKCRSAVALSAADLVVEAAGQAVGPGQRDLTKNDKEL